VLWTDCVGWTLAWLACLRAIDPNLKFCSGCPKRCQSAWAGVHRVPQMGYSHELNALWCYTKTLQELTISSICLGRPESCISNRYPSTDWAVQSAH
jgi:hypothetical protein